MDIIDAEFTEVRSKRSFKPIWIDRIALVLGILLTGIVLLYAYGGIEFSVPLDEVFFTALKLVWGITLTIWIVGRGLDFIFTGRIRH